MIRSLQYLCLISIIIFCQQLTYGQAAGSSAYSQQPGSSVYNQRTDPRTTVEKPTGTIFRNNDELEIAVNVLMNVKAESYVATFNAIQDCTTAGECIQKIDARIAAFITDARALGIPAENLFVDFIAQNPVYDYTVVNNLAKEKQVGFEIKKNILIYYKDKNLTDRLVTVASQNGIYDLVKVEYLVPDTSEIKRQMLEEALKLIKEKENRYRAIFNYKFRSHVLVEREKYGILYPPDMYTAYNAYETGRIRAGNININNNVLVNSNSSNSALRVQEARKSTGFYYNPLNADGFDLILNPVINEPVVQFTLLLQVKYTLDR